MYRVEDQQKEMIDNLIAHGVPLYGKSKFPSKNIATYPDEYLDVYNQELIEIVEQAYREDLEYYNYAFNIDRRSVIDWVNKFWRTVCRNIYYLKNIIR